jgi:phage baseplate assembly protein W
MFVNYPYGFDGRGRTAEATREDHLRQMIELVLFTSPGERVNRPTFGSGVMQLVFSPNSPQVASALQMAIQGALQLWLGDDIQVDQVTASNDDAQLTVTVNFTDRARQLSQTATFVRRTG